MKEGALYRGQREHFFLSLAPSPTVFSFDLGSDFAPLFPLLYETQTKNTSEYRLLRRVQVIGMERTAKKCDALVDMLLCSLNQLILAISLLKLSTVKFSLTRKPYSRNEKDWTSLFV